GSDPLRLRQPRRLPLPGGPGAPRGRRCGGPRAGPRPPARRVAGGRRSLYLLLAAVQAAHGPLPPLHPGVLRRPARAGRVRGGGLPPQLPALAPVLHPALRRRAPPGLPLRAALEHHLALRLPLAVAPHRRPAGGQPPFGGAPRPPPP